VYNHVHLSAVTDCTNFPLWWKGTSDITCQFWRSRNSLEMEIILVVMDLKHPNVIPFTAWTQPQYKKAEVGKFKWGLCL